MWSAVLIDSCVLLDAFLPFRASHANATGLFEKLDRAGIQCFIPSHSYFECAVACIVHFKADPVQLQNNPATAGSVPHLKLNVVNLSLEYVEKALQVLLVKPIPDLKSSDLIYFCIARKQGLPLITQDRKLRNTARKGGIESFNVDEALTKF